MVFSKAKLKVVSRQSFFLLLLVFVREDSAATLQRSPSLNENDKSVCDSKGCVMAAAILLSNMDSRYNPCEDFYRFACGGFEIQHLAYDTEIHADIILDNKMKPLLKELLTRVTNENEPRIFQKLRDFYSSCLTADSLAKTQVEGLKQFLEEYGGWPLLKGHAWNLTEFSWQDMSARLVSEGLGIASILGIDLFYNFDRTVTEYYRVIRIRNPAILKENNDIREAYQKLIEDVALYLGGSQDLVHEEVEEIMTFYKDFSKIITQDTTNEEEILEMSSAENFSAENSTQNFTFDDMSELNSLVTVADLYRISDEIDWQKYLRQMFPVHIDSNTSVYLRIDEIKLKNLIAFLMKTPKRTLANFIMWKIVFEAIDLTHEPELIQKKQMYRDMTFTAIPTKKERHWIRCLRETSIYLTPALTALYGKYYFPQEHKEQVLKIFEQIRSSTEILIGKTDWLDNSTLHNLKHKLSNFDAIVAYPDDLLIDEELDKNYENLTIFKNEYLLNIINLRKLRHSFESKETLMNISKNHWMHIGSLLQTNAYYFRFLNALVLPVSQLRGIYFSPDRLQALNFGSLGSVFGHELFHGVNEFGMVKYSHSLNWWTPEDTEAFMERAACIQKQYDNFPLRSKITVDGFETLDENLSDNSGLKVAYLAYQSWVKANGNEPHLTGMKNFTGNQLFWLAFANSWCTSTNSIIQSEHDREFFQLYSPNNYRVIGAIQNMEEFGKDFGCPAGSPMNPVEKCAVW